MGNLGGELRQGATVGKGKMAIRPVLDARRGWSGGIARTLSGFALLDLWRAGLGRTLDAAGWGPQPTPSRIIFSSPGVRLRAYGGGPGPSLLLVPAPIKRAYIWDLAPAYSVVRRALERGCRVYLLEWLTPAPLDAGLEEYADHLIGKCVEAIRAEDDQPLFLAGHSLGGTFSAIFCALHPELAHGLILVGAPVNFAYDTDLFSRFITALPAHGLSNHQVPGSILTTTTLAAAPLTVGYGAWLDRLASIHDPVARDTLRRVERWVLDEFQMPGKLLSEVIQRLMRNNEFQRGVLQVGGRRASSENLRDVPTLIVTDRRCAIVPPVAVEPLMGQGGRGDVQVLNYAGDTGVLMQHVGLLVGRSAHRTLWPAILDWIARHAAREGKMSSR